MARLENGINELEKIIVNRENKVEIDIYKQNTKNLPITHPHEFKQKEIEELLKSWDKDPVNMLRESRVYSVPAEEAALKQLKAQNPADPNIKIMEIGLEIMKSDPGINKVFYESVIRENHAGKLIKAGTTEEKTALRYLKSWENYPKSNLTYFSPEYLNNRLENEAIREQLKYVFFRSGLQNNIYQELGLIANKDRK